jgi:hypothetical protein
MRSATVTILSPSPRHRAVLFQDFADHAGGLQPCQPRQVHAALGLAGAHQHPAFARAQRIDVAGADEFGAGRVLAHGLQNGGRAIACRDARTAGAPRGDRHGECGAERSLVITDHHAEAELVDSLGRHRQANQAAPVFGHEVDGFRRCQLGGHAEVALVFALLVIHQDDHAAAANLFERFLDRDERGLALFARD